MQVENCYSLVSRSFAPINVIADL